MSGAKRNFRAGSRLARRATAQTLRRPPLVGPILILPTVVLIAFSGGGASAVDLPGFPEVPSFFDFELPGIVTMSAALAGVSGALALAGDLEMTFMDRVLAAPLWRGVPVVGRLAGSAALAVVSCVWFFTLGLIFGDWPSEGVLGLLVIAGLAALTAAAVASVIATIAIRTRQSSVIQGFFPLMLFFLLLSSAYFPRHLLHEPARTIAGFNPLTAVADAMRDAWIGELSVGATVGAAGAVAALALVGAVGWGLALVGTRR
ncbi:MAG TPA: ABC transporter permease [Thermoleophilaceae bacterium]|jgi:ABC-type multidrug transport system permease subunit